MTKSEDAIVGCLGEILLLTVSIPLAALTAKCFWNWYVLPLTGFHSMNMTYAFGFGAFVALYRSVEIRKNEPESHAEIFYRAWFSAVLRYGTIWTVAGLIHLFGSL